MSMEAWYTHASNHEKKTHTFYTMPIINLPDLFIFLNSSKYTGGQPWVDRSRLFIAYWFFDYFEFFRVCRWTPWKAESGGKSHRESTASKLGWVHGLLSTLKIFHLTSCCGQGNNKMKLDSITSIGLWVGMALIALAWLKLIPLLYGWIGFAIAVPSFIVEEIKKKNTPPSGSDDTSR